MTHRHGCTARPARCSRTSPWGGALLAPLTTPWTMLPRLWGLHSTGARFQTLPRGGAKLRNHLSRGCSARAPCDGSTIPPDGSGHNRHGRSICRDAARTWWARQQHGLHGASLGRAVWVRHCLARGPQASSDSRIGCSLQDSPALVPVAHGTVAHPRVTLYINPPSPQAPRPSPKPSFQYSETARNWPKSQISLAALDAPRRRG